MDLHALLRNAGLVLAMILASGCQSAYFRVVNVGVPADIAHSVEFDPAHGLSLDIYPPSQTRSRSPAPVLIFFYGGSWHNGERSYYKFVGEALASHGVLVLIPDYRKAPDNVFPAFMEDAASATAWARAHVAELGGDPSRIYLMGHSAGAHIAVLLATDPSYLGKWQMKPRDLAGVIGLSGPYDFMPVVNHSIQKVFGDPANWQSSQPLNFIDGDEPPFLLLHGARDQHVWPRSSERLAARLHAAGDSVTLRIIPGAGHTGVVYGFLSPRYSPVLKDSLDWIGGEGAAPAGSSAGTASSN